MNKSNSSSAMNDTEAVILLDRFMPRDYQLPFCEALEEEGYKKLLAIWPRRSGKDICCWNLMLRQAVERVGVYFYCLPTFRQARLVIWDSITNDGTKFIDFIPKELIANVNNSEMKITLINGSILQLIGSDTYDTSLIGTNPRMVIFSEYALADPRAYTLGARPILNANDGAVIIISTPRSKNALWDLYNIALQNESWYVSKLTLDDTKHVSVEDIQSEIASGEISQDMVNQEYYTSFEIGGVQGSYYAHYLDQANLDGRISDILWDPSKPVYTAWDLGVRDATAIIFFQLIGNTLAIIDCYDNTKQGLEHYVNIVLKKPYTYGKHIAPHDIKVKEFSTGQTRIEKARALGISFTVAPSLSVEDGMEALRSTLARMTIDQTRCVALIKALYAYRQEYDHVRKVYKPKPLHDWSSNWADAARYMAISQRLLKRATTGQEWDKLYQEAVYGQQLPGPFMDPTMH